MKKLGMLLMLLSLGLYVVGCGGGDTSSTGGGDGASSANGDAGGDSGTTDGGGATE